MKEDILAMNSEAEGHQSAIVKIGNDLAVLRGNVNYSLQTTSGISVLASSSQNNLP